MLVLNTNCSKIFSVFKFQLSSLSLSPLLDCLNVTILADQKTGVCILRLFVVSCWTPDSGWSRHGYWCPCRLLSPHSPSPPSACFLCSCNQVSFDIRNEVLHRRQLFLVHIIFLGWAAEKVLVFNTKACNIEISGSTQVPFWSRGENGWWWWCPQDDCTQAATDTRDCFSLATQRKGGSAMGGCQIMQ